MEEGKRPVTVTLVITYFISLEFRSRTFGRSRVRSWKFPAIIKLVILDDCVRVRLALAISSRKAVAKTWLHPSV